MKDVQDRLGMKNSDLLKKEICSRFSSRELTEKQKMKYIRSEYQITKDLQDSDLYKYAKNNHTKKIKDKTLEFFRDLKKMKYLKEKNIQ